MSSASDSFQTMKNRILSFALVLLALATPAFANIKQVTGLSGTVKTLIVPGPRATWICIQNNGSNSVRITVDGGSTYTDPNTGNPGTDPTASTGYLLAAGQQLVILTAPGTFLLPIRAIMVTGTTTVDIVTNDFGTLANEFPTN
jgi:hypothetical protein